MPAIRRMATIRRASEFKDSVEYLSNTVPPEYIKDKCLQDNCKELIVEFRGYESDAAMITESLSSYNEQFLPRRRHILHETDLDKEFLCSVNVIGQENRESMDINPDNANIDYSNTISNGEFFTFTDQQLGGQFQTNYDTATGETRVKLGMYDYPIDIASCFTDAEKCLQENHMFPEDIVNESTLEELYRAENYGRVRESIPLSDISATCTKTHSYVSIAESPRSRSVPDIENTIPLHENDQESTLLSFTPLYSYNDKKEHCSNVDLICGDAHDSENSGRKIRLPTFVSVLNVQTNNIQLSNYDSMASACNDQTVPPITQTSSLFNGNTTTNTHVINSDLSSPYFMGDSTMLNLSNGPVSNSENRRTAARSAFPVQRSLREFARSNSSTSQMKMSKHKRTIEKTQTIEKQSHRPIKQEASLLVPYLHESLLSSSKIWKSTQCTNPKQKKRLTRGCKLWEFIRNLLLSRDTNPSMIKWEDRGEGTFKLVQSKAIAQMWGMKKGNRDMTYEKLSRAMRYYYKKQVFQPVLGKRLIYKFGSRATGWRYEECI